MMKELFKIIPIVLYLLVGMISLVMAFKSLLSAKFLPFHEKAAGKPWDEVENSIKPVILSLLKISGLGFLIISILLIVFPVVNYFIPNNFYKYSIPGAALLYCFGLFVINYFLYKSTKAETPWKGSLYAMVVITAGIIISILNQYAIKI